MKHLVFDISDKADLILAINSKGIGTIIPLEIKGDLCVISESVYNENKSVIDNTGKSYEKRTILQTEWITLEQ